MKRIVHFAVERCQSEETKAQAARGAYRALRSRIRFPCSTKAQAALGAYRALAGHVATAGDAEVRAGKAQAALGTMRVPVYRALELNPLRTVEGTGGTSRLDWLER